LSERVVRPGAEILLWANDMMVRQFLDVARSLARRLAQYLKAGPEAIKWRPSEWCMWV